MDAPLFNGQAFALEPFEAVQNLEHNEHKGRLSCVSKDAAWFIVFQQRITQEVENASQAVFSWASVQEDE